MRFESIEAQDKYLTEVERSTKLILEDVQERIERLGVFDFAEEISAHCNDLMAEVSLAIESGVEHLCRLERKLHKEIDEYHRECLEATLSAAFADQVASTKRELEALAEASSKFDQEAAAFFVKAREIVEGLIEFDDDSTELEDESTDDEFKDRRTGVKHKRKPLFRSNKKPALEKKEPEKRLAFTTQDTKDLLQRANELAFKVTLFASKVKRDSFGERLVKFNVNHEFFASDDLIGRLLSYRQTPRLPQNKQSNITASLSQTLRGFTNINVVQFVTDQVLASTSFGKRVKLWNKDNGQLLHMLLGHDSYIRSLVMLPNGWLVSGTADSVIRLWDIKKIQVARLLEGHCGAVVALQVLHSQYLASLSLDGTIKIWSPFSAGNNLIQTIWIDRVKGSWRYDLGLLSNDHLVTCGSAGNYGVVNIWSPRDGSLVRAVHMGFVPISLLVLPNDTLVVGGDDGSLKIINLANGTKSMIVIKAHEGGIHSLLRLPNGLLLSANRHIPPTIKVWNPENSQLLQTLSITHPSQMRTLAVSADGKFLAIGPEGPDITVWSLKY